MRINALILVISLIFGSLLTAESQAPDLIEIARQAALPRLPADAEPASSAKIEVDTSALGCRLIAGVALPDSIEVQRIEFELDGAAYAVHLSADGSLIQVCDERFPNLGRGTQPVQRASADSDGDGLADSMDHCPQIAGIAADFSAERQGCPHVSDSDSDGDGTPDRHDRCPAQAGAAATDGCAILSDNDGDGVPNHIDTCPADAGVIRLDFALGCPADGSGASSTSRAPHDICQIIGASILVYAERASSAEVIERPSSAEVIGRSAALTWYQVTGGWVRAEGARLEGDCFNIPLVNPDSGGATGCFMRPRGDYVNVRMAPSGRQVARLYKREQQAVLGANSIGDWLFYRAGWVSRAVIELAGNCERLPILNPTQVASGTIHFCPPDFSGFLPPRIGIGVGNARVASSTLPNRLRAQPDAGAEQIGEISPQSRVDAILDGPACHAPYVWWQVEVDGKVGWTVESDINAYHYYLEPAASSGAIGPEGEKPALSQTGRQASNSLIHSANLISLNTVALLHVSAPIAVAWTPDQSALAALSDAGDITLFHLPNLQPTQIVSPLAAAASAVAFSPDGNWLAAGDLNGGVTIIELTENTEVGQAYSLAQQVGPIRALAWAAAGDRLAAISGAEPLILARQAGTLRLWQFDAAAPSSSALLLHYRFPHPLTAAAFSRGGRWLAISGDSSRERRAALWVYDAETGDVAMSKALIPMSGHGLVTSSPYADLGDFVYSSGDSLWSLSVDSGVEQRFYHQAGALSTGIAFRRQVIPGAEALMALTTLSSSGQTKLTFANALNPYSPTAAFSLAPAAIAFSPDGRLLAAAEPEEDRIRLVGATVDV